MLKIRKQSSCFILAVGKIISRCRNSKYERFILHGRTDFVTNISNSFISNKFITNKVVTNKRITKINVDEEEELASLFSIRSIPTLIFIEKNGTMHRSQGAMGKPQLKEAIEKILLR
ncbi:MAG: hypothetical protein J6U89_08210 [Bacteroidaceae bacterium]|nr:hypothetical protein [Bacteroidaceae bacterium]